MEELGADVDDFGYGLDRSAGVLGVRLYVGCQLQGVHRPSHALSRREVWRLWRWSRGAQNGLPRTLQGWWLEMDEEQRSEVRALLRGTPWYVWAGLWLVAS